jgi:hypothetical protein
VHSSPSPPAKPKRRGSSVMEEVIQQAFSEEFGRGPSAGQSGSTTLSRQGRTRGGSYVPFDGSGGASSLLSGTAGTAGGTADMADASSMQGVSAPDPDHDQHFYTDEQGYYHQHQRAPVTATTIAENMDVVPVGVTLCNAKGKGTQRHSRLIPSQIEDISKVTGRARGAYIFIPVCVCPPSFFCLFVLSRSSLPQAWFSSTHFLSAHRLSPSPTLSSLQLNFTPIELWTIARKFHTLTYTPTRCPHSPLTTTRC